MSKIISKKNHKTTQETPRIQRSGFFVRPLRVSQKWAYGTFLSISIGVTTLLYGAALSAGTHHVALIKIPDPRARMEQRVADVVEGYPIKQMSPYIARYNETTAAFLVGIAKKESKWGKRVPVDENGDDCFNYWGYRGAGSRGIAMGHGCFGSPEEAVGIVGGRIDTFVREYEFDTPEELIVWKCGWSCDGHSSQSVKKWIADVGIYYRKVKD